MDSKKVSNSILYQRGIYWQCKSGWWQYNVSVPGILCPKVFQYYVECNVFTAGIPGYFLWRDFIGVFSTDRYSGTSETVGWQHWKWSSGFYRMGYTGRSQSRWNDVLYFEQYSGSPSGRNNAESVWKSDQQYTGIPDQYLGNSGVYIVCYRCWWMGCSDQRNSADVVIRKLNAKSGSRK